MKQIPIIRFSQFDDKWGSIAIGDLAQIKRGASPRPIQDPKWFDKNSDIGWLRISDVTEQNGRIKYLEQKISKLGQEKTRVLNTPHLLLSIAATVGKPVVNYVKTGVHDGFLIFENPKFDREFMFQWFDMFRPKWNKYGQPGSQVNLNSDIIRNHKMMIPSLPEQSAIGPLLRTLDELLASYKDNLANYQSLKATMLSKMFPKAGQSVPEIRLDGFKGEWRIIKLGDVLSELKSGLSRELSNDDIGLPVIRANNISDGNLNLDRDIKYWFKDDPKGANTANYFVRENDILVNFINSEAKMGTAAIVLREPDRETIYTTNILKLTVKEDYYPYFIYFMTFVQSYQNYIKSITKPAVNQASFTTVDFKKYEFLCPEFQEQQTISAYFLNLDNLINSHQEKISQLETLKKKLLQDMFI